MDNKPPIYYDIPYDQKDTILARSKSVLVWNKERRKFQLNKITQDMKHFNDYQVHYIHVPYASKDEAKNLGAKWDPKATSWYYTGDDIEGKFKQYNELTI